MTMLTSLSRLWQRLRGTTPARPPLLRPEQAPHVFLSRYRCFRDLLAANTNTLEAMAALEQALLDGRTLSMTFIRARCTLVTVNVYKIIASLNILADGRYRELTTIFNRLQEGIDALLTGTVVGSGGELLLPLERIGRAQAELCGEKMANLGEAGSLAGISIPPGFALTAVATRLFFERNQLYPKINHIIQQLDIGNLEDLDRKSAAIQELIRSCPLPQEVETQLFDAFDRLAGGDHGLRLAVRSSALGEDLGQASFAGLYHTELGVDRDHLVDATRAVLASKYSPRAISYRLAKGFRHEESEMCVGFLAMVEARLSGVCYSRSIGGSDDTLDLFLAPGPAKGIVDGTCATQHLRISRGIPHGLVEDSLANGEPSLLDAAQISELAELALRLEHHFGAPQDIEWSIDQDGALFILQCRPITALPAAPQEVDHTTGADDRLRLCGGVTACPGVACGPVHFVGSREAMHRFPNRAVLVVRHPLPEWAPLLKRAVALVAETGSEAGHLATIAREYRLPALLALPQVGEQLREGELVTVDAGRRCVYAGRVEALLQEPPQRVNPMEGSPVQRTLIELLKLISPLHLTDPAAPEFQAVNCRTMHDITRFCHEKSVVEMFDFGNRHHFDQAVAKRLRDTLPLEWWVIDLGEGLRPGFDHHRRDIAITDIACIPMLAIWEGMHAVPWDGPPAPRLGTMLSFLLQASIHDGLDRARSTALREKNYFLLSKNYCNLSLRLGYHYAMIEAMLGERPTDRYITFRFQGGAAEEEQRLRRIDLLAGILEHFAYRIDRVGDALTARVERASERFVIDRLKVLGFLTIHARQLDVVMAEAGAQQFFCDKFIQEIEEMLHHDH